MKVLFVAGFGPIIQHPTESVALYKETLGLPFQEDNGYFHTEDIKGVKHFALWPLEHAAQECFGSSEWPKDIVIPQSWLEFDVENMDDATAELKAKGYKLLVENETKPWKQTVTRFLSPEGMLVSVTYTPWMRDT